MCAALRGKIKVFNEMEANFKVSLHYARVTLSHVQSYICSKESFLFNFVSLQHLSRALVNIASKLNNTKDVRDLFIDLVEKVNSASLNQIYYSIYNCVYCFLSVF